MSADIEREFRAERAWIGSCEDVRAVLDKMVGYRRDLASATRGGDTLRRLRAGDLLGIAEDRVCQLKAAQLRLRVAKARAAPPVETAELTREQQLPEAPGAAFDEFDRASSATLCDQPDRPGSQSGRAMCRPGRSETPRPPVAPVREGPRLGDHATPTRGEARSPAIRRKSRDGRPHGPTSSGEARVPPVLLPIIPPSASHDLPEYTGRDLAEQRIRCGMTQRDFAAVLGVEQGTVSKGEGRDSAPVGPALRAALHRLRTQR